MSRWYKKLLFLLPLVFLLSIITSGYRNVNAESEISIQAVLFFSPTCSHCQKVINEDLPPLFEKYGDQLQIIGINVTTAEGQALFLSFIEAWNIPAKDQVLPTLVVDNIYLVGSVEIPERFPGIIATSLLEGGIKWPEISGLTEIITQIEQQAEEQAGGDASDPESLKNPETPASGAIDAPLLSNDQADQLDDNPDLTETPGDRSANFTIAFDDEITAGDRFRQDLAGNTLAVITLAGMVLSVIMVLITVLRTTPSKGRDWSRLIPILAILGFLVAGYLSFVEVTETEAVCGPVGDCNSVQQSPYARLFGILPIGILGLTGYVVILVSWVLKQYGPNAWQENLIILTWGMALFGVIFSIYLTYLEPFVIGATCIWCISSAIIITLLLWASTEPVRQIWAEPEEDIQD